MFRWSGGRAPADASASSRFDGRLASGAGGFAGDGGADGDRGFEGDREGDRARSGGVVRRPIPKPRFLGSGAGAGA